MDGPGPDPPNIFETKSPTPSNENGRGRPVLASSFSCSARSP